MSTSLWWPILSTALIIALILGLTWWIKFVGLTPISQLQGRFKILARCGLGPREQLVIVQIDDHCLLLGATAHSIQLLDRFDAPLETDTPPSKPTPPFSMILACLRGRPTPPSDSVPTPKKAPPSSHQDNGTTNETL